MDDDSLKRKKRSSWGNKDYNQRNYGKEFGSRGSESQGNFPSCRRILTFEILVKYYSSYTSSISIIIITLNREITTSETICDRPIAKLQEKLREQVWD